MSPGLIRAKDEKQGEAYTGVVQRAVRGLWSDGTLDNSIYSGLLAVSAGLIRRKMARKIGGK